VEVNGLKNALVRTSVPSVVRAMIGEVGYGHATGGGGDDVHDGADFGVADITGRERCDGWIGGCILRRARPVSVLLLFSVF